MKVSTLYLPGTVLLVVSLLTFALHRMEWQHYAKAWKSSLKTTAAAGAVFAGLWSTSLLLTLLAGFVVALIGSIALAIVCEHFDPSLKSPQQIEYELGIPVLLSVPRSRRHVLLHN